MSIAMQINPFDYFSDLLGDALDEGYIWIGLPNKNPQSYPVQVYFDAAMTIPAAQPLRTNAGYIVRGGSPSYLFTNGNYSILVQNKKNEQVFYVPDFLMIGNNSAVSMADLASFDSSKGAGMVGHPTGKTLLQSLVCIRNVSELRALLTPTPISGVVYSVSTLGYYDQGDGGGAKFYYDSSDTTTPDNGGTVIVTALGARWKMIIDGAPVSARAFGAKADGLTDDSLRVRASVAALGYADIPISASGCVFGGVDISTNQSLFCSNDQKARVIVPASASYGVRVTSYAGLIPTVQGQFGVIKNLHFDGALCPVSTTAVRFGTSSAVVYGARLSNLNFTNFGESLGDESHPTNYVVDMMFQDIACSFTRSRQVYFRRSAGFIYFKGFKVDHTLNTGPVTYEGVRLDQVAGVELEQFDVLGPALQNAYQPASLALIISGAGGYNASVWMNRVLIDTTNGIGIYIKDIFNVVAKDTGVHLTLGDSIVLENVTRSRFVNTSVFGGRNRSGAPAGSSGMKLLACQDNTFTNTSIVDVTGAGVFLSNSIANGFTNTNIRNCIGIGMHHIGTSDYNVSSLLYSLGNTGGSLTQVGANSATVNWYPNSSAYTASTVGAATI